MLFSEGLQSGAPGGGDGDACGAESRPCLGAGAGVNNPASAFATRHRNLIIALAARHRLPPVYAYRYMVATGGLGPSRSPRGRLRRPLKGETLGQEYRDEVTSSAAAWLARTEALQAPKQLVFSLPLATSRPSRRPNRGGARVDKQVGSSQGWATMVVAGGTSFALAISRSYFEVGGLPNGLVVLIAPISLSVSIRASPLTVFDYARAPS